MSDEPNQLILQANTPLGELVTRMDQRSCEELGEREYGVFIDLIMTLLPSLIQLFQNCPKKPKPVTPVNPTPTPTPAQSTAWDNAWDMKCRANDAWSADQNDYNRHAVQVWSKHIRKQKRKNGEPVSQEQAQTLARNSFDAARLEDMPVLAGAIEQVKGS